MYFKPVTFIIFFNAHIIDLIITKIMDHFNTHRYQICHFVKYINSFNAFDPCPLRDFCSALHCHLSLCISVMDSGLV